MFKNLGKLRNIESKKNFVIDINQLNAEINLFEDFIIYKKNNIIKIYNRVCDHAGGKIISKDNETICPVHNWKFNARTGLYNNGVKKKEINYLIDENTLKIQLSDYQPEIIKLTQKNLTTDIRFFNHAFLKIIGKNFSFSTDPWAIGPAFNTGWWLKHRTKDDWIQSLNKSNFIYISHNHPDHLHPLTLSKINKNIPIIVPNFITDSTGRYIDELGFKNTIRLDFNIQYNLKNTDLVICLLKSGDFREDSGIYFSHGKFSGLLSVDSNMLNFERFPKVDLYAGSFAGGATGYPLMFENYKLSEQVKIAERDTNFTKIKKLRYLKKIRPFYFMPYAGFFEEKLERDIKIKKNNKKNSIKDFSYFCKKNDIELLDVIKKDFYNFKGKKLISSKSIIKKYTKDLDKEKYLEYYKSEYNKIDENFIKNYFTNSDYKDNLHLYILLTDDNFKLITENYFIDFSNDKIVFKRLQNFTKSNILKNSKFRKLVLKVRKESFLNTIYNKLPWEDLSIGFQCKVFRNPNVYNVNFWHHFTNTYTTSKNVRSVTECGACTKLTQFFDKNIASNVKNI